MSLIAWIPHFHTEYLAIVPVSNCDCGKCRVAVCIHRDAIEEFDIVLELTAFLAFGRPWRPRVTRIQ